jgi:hypothetical protein
MKESDMKELSTAEMEGTVDKTLRVTLAETSVETGTSVYNHK